jgi:hypothetical protein
MLTGGQHPGIFGVTKQGNPKMSYPDSINLADLDAAQGTDDAPNDAGELAWIKSALELLNEAADKLRGADHSDRLLNDTCADAGREIEILVAAIARRMP